ncbi:MAG: hypothetical protein V7641_455 [Blastocatellia bacterium]
MTVKTFPQVRKATFGAADISKEREWLLQHDREYVGEWVVLGEGHLIGHTVDSNEVAALVDKARAQGIHLPYVKFVSDRPEPVWMGWL